MNQIDLPWLAGIFEGEGTCGIYQDRREVRWRKDSWHYNVRIYNNDRSMLEEIQKLVGGKINAKCQTGNWIWSAGRREIQRQFLLSLLPFIRSGYKKSQIENWLYTDSILPERKVGRNL